jgi:hypothetical protein
MTATKTAGQQFTAHVAKSLAIGGKTRNHRGSRNMRNEILETVDTACQYPGYWTPERQSAIRAASTAVAAYRKHILGARVDSIVCWYVREGMSPYRFAQFLGRMVDAKISNMGEAELFFDAMRDEANAAYTARHSR